MSRLISDWSHARKEITGDRRDFKWGKHHLHTPWLEEDSEQMIFGLRPEREGGRERKRPGRTPQAKEMAYAKALKCRI